MLLKQKPDSCNEFYGIITASVEAGLMKNQSVSASGIDDKIIV